VNTNNSKIEKRQEKRKTGKKKIKRQSCPREWILELNTTSRIQSSSFIGYILGREVVYVVFLIESINLTSTFL